MRFPYESHVWYIYLHYMYYKNQPNVGATIVSKKRVGRTTTWWLASWAPLGNKKKAIRKLMQLQLIHLIQMVHVFHCYLSLLGT